jgi:hypothetical protein
MAVTWDKGVRFAVDPTRGGTPNPGLSGRLYLFGFDGKFPLEGDGSLVVELYDDTPLVTGGQTCLKERWVLDDKTLKRLLQKDTIGWGYTLFLPWGTYNRAITQIHLITRYTAMNGAPLFDPTPTMTIAQPEIGTPQAQVRMLQPSQNPVPSQGAPVGPQTTAPGAQLALPPLTASR